MELIDQNAKRIMEECKVRSREAGLVFDKETLEYIVTNKDLVELSPKVMIPTLYDFWVYDVEVLKGKGVYKLYPNNPYETVINSRPAISFYNDNNPDWLNTMIFYHVLGHIDFFQNNILFEKTWNDDFVGQALADKRLLESLRSEHGRWADYALEFSRSIDNLVGYFDLISMQNFPEAMNASSRLTYYFDVFLQEIEKVPEHKLYSELERYNALFDQHSDTAESSFFAEVKVKYPEFQTKFEKYSNLNIEQPIDVMEFIRDNSPFLRNETNHWIKSVMNIVRNTSLYFSPQMRTKIINEGWASYWHDTLFRSDERISGHEVEYARTNAYVTSISRVGLNPYAIGLRLIQYIEELAAQGRLTLDFQKIRNIEQRENYNQPTGKGRETILKLRRLFSDFTLINTFVDQEFVDKHGLFVVGKYLNEERGTYQYYVKSRKAADYKQMLIDSLYHPVKITVDLNKTSDSNLYLRHSFEGKQLYKPYIPEVLVALEYLWGGQVQLETTDIYKAKPKDEFSAPTFEYKKVLYTIKDRKLNKQELKPNA